MWRFAARLAVGLVALLSWAALAQDKPIDAGPYVASPDSAVAAMLREADVGPNDYLIDLGSGDGRIVRTAAKVFGARGMGVEIQDKLVQLSKELAKQEGIADRVEFVTRDLFKTDISKASVVTMYLLPHTVNQLGPKLLAELRPGARVVSHDYALAGWAPHKQLELEDTAKVAISGVARTVIYVYVIPAQVAGSWTVEPPPSLPKPFRLELAQENNRASGWATLGSSVVPMLDLELVGERLSFRLPGHNGRFHGRASGDRIEGTYEAGGAAVPWRASRSG